VGTAASDSPMCSMQGRLRDEFDELEDAGDTEDAEDLDDADDTTVTVVAAGGYRSLRRIFQAVLPFKNR
jgi:hypothetical protein